MAKLRAFTAPILALLAIGILVWPLPSERHFPERKPVRFWHMWSGEWKEVIDKIVARFNASQTEYELIALSVPQGASTKCLLGVAGGDPPDVMAQWEAVIPTWAARGAIQPLDKLLTPEENARFQQEAYPGVLRIGPFNGHLYAMTPTMNLSAVYVNPVMLKEAGLDINQFPKTLEGLVEWGKKLDRFDAQKNLTRMGYMPGSWSNLAPLFGGGFYDWKNGKLSLNHPANVRALKFLVSERTRLGFDNVVRFTSGFGPDAGGQWSFLAGKLAMVVDGQWRVEQIGKVAPNFQYKVFPVPPPAGGVPLAGSTGGNQMIIPAGAKEPKGAMEFIKFWSGFKDPEVGAEFITWGGWLPMTKPVAESKTYQTYLRRYPEFKKFVDLMPSKQFQPLPPVTVEMFISDKINQCQDLALRGSVTPEEAVNRLEKDVKDEIARRAALGDK